MSAGAERMRRLRERKAAALAPVDGPSPLPADEQLAPAVEATDEALKLGPEHEAVAQLARRYASLIDRAEDPAAALRHLGPAAEGADGAAGDAGQPPGPAAGAQRPEQDGAAPGRPRPAPGRRKRGA